MQDWNHVAAKCQQVKEADHAQKVDAQKVGGKLKVRKSW